MEKAVARIRRALVSGETMVVYGDFDADGICGTAILVEGLARLGGKMLSYFPIACKRVTDSTRTPWTT